MAAAQCTSIPYTLTDGTPASASQVMANFQCAALLGGANFTGNVGIGASSPSTLLSLGSSITTIKLGIYDGAGSNIYGIGVNPGELTFGAAIAPTGVPQMVLTAAGAVGIDTTTPGDNLDVNGQVAIGSSPERLSLNSGSIGFNRRVATGQIYNTAYSAYQWQHFENSDPANDYLVLLVYSPTGALQNGGAIAINGYGGVSIDGGPQPGWNFTVNGQAGGGASWAVYSDARLKTNIVPLKDALAKVLQLQGVSYDWVPPAGRSVGKDLNLPDAPQIGFIAQDVAKVVPEAVVAPTDPQNNLYGLMESKLIPLLVEAIKDQEAEIKAQKSEITTLQAQVAKLQ